MFVGPGYVITLPNERLQPLEYLFERCRGSEETRDALFSKGPGYLLYKIIDDCVDASFPMLRKMGNKLEHLEGEIFEGRSQEVVRDLSNVKQEIITFRKVVRPQRTVLNDLERTKQRFIPDDLDIYFDDITDASERIWDMLENYKEVVEGLESTNESVLSHRVNDVLRVLTAFSVVILPLTFLAEPVGDERRRARARATARPSGSWSSRCSAFSAGCSATSATEAGCNARNQHARVVFALPCPTRSRRWRRRRRSLSSAPPPAPSACS